MAALLEEGSESYNNRRGTDSRPASSTGSATPGSFGVASAQSTPQRRAAVAEVKRLALKVLGAQSPPIVAQVTALESRCPDDGCPDRETTILVRTIR